MSHRPLHAWHSALLSEKRQTLPGRGTRTPLPGHSPGPPNAGAYFAVRETGTRYKEHYFKANPTKSPLIAIPPWLQAPPPVMGEKTNPGMQEAHSIPRGRCLDCRSRSCHGATGDTKPSVRSGARSLDSPIPNKGEGVCRAPRRGPCRSTGAAGGQCLLSGAAQFHFPSESVSLKRGTR